MAPGGGASGRPARKRARPVADVVAGVAKVIRAERRAWPSGHRVLPAAAATPLDLLLGPAASPVAGQGRPAPLVACGSSSESESESESSEAKPQQAPAAAAPQAPVRLELLLPREWRSDRGLQNCWEKARLNASLCDVDFEHDLHGVFLVGASVSSKSQDAPRSVDLVRCSCDCPSPRPFCSHLFTAAEAAPCPRLRGRLVLMCHLRERLLRRVPDRAAMRLTTPWSIAVHVVRELREAVDALSARVSNVEVDFKDPSAGFDRRKVKGIVASLVKLKDARNATAIEVACGAKLYQLVVQDEVTGKELLSKGQLKRRVTIIPLNKIESTSLSPAQLQAADKAVGRGRADLALELVGYEAEIERAIKYVLGKTMVCKDVEAAKTCAFGDGIRARSVTLDGDLFDPAGTLTGGARAKASSSVLLTFGELLDKRAALADAEARLTALRAEAARAKAAANQHAALEQKAANAEHQAALTRTRLEGNPYFTAAEDLRRMEEEVANADGTCKAKEDERKGAEKEVARLEGAIKELSGSWDKLMATKDKEIGDERKKLEGLQKKLKEVREATEGVLLESAAAAEEKAAVLEQIAAAEAALAPVLAEVEAAAAEVAQARAAFEEAEGAAKAKRDAVKQADADIKAAGKDCDRMRAAVEKKRLELKKLEHAIARFEKDTADAHRAVEHLLRQHAWIASERHLFGKAGTDYDWKAMDPAKAEKRLKEVAGEQEKLGKKINKKVMGMFEKAEQEYQEVMEKKRIVENDKAKIEAVMEELDEKKNQALKNTWAKVNRDFSSIFHTLLPNAQAKLQPPEGGTVLDGLVLKVGFGDCWKESLSELSGGQRSLLALSLILALLLFKPAPMYILDEIDAALDLSHTQNIGSMLRTHFKNSQFIIVSLKEGMFNNANVLYRTKFVDGVSTVARTTPGAR